MALRVTPIIFIGLAALLGCASSAPSGAQRTAGGSASSCTTVADLQARAAALTQQFKNRGPGGRVERFPDLDGDGQEERLITGHECGATGACVFELYLSGASCLHYAGKADGWHELQPGHERHHGVRDIIASGAWCHGVRQAVLTFDGIRFVQAPAWVQEGSATCGNETAPQQQEQ